MTPVVVARGTGPVVLGIPHAGTHVPDEIKARLNERGRALADTDWHVDRLYAGLLPDATAVRATFHRYVIDANRDPSGASLYPGQNTTALVPLTDFEGRGIWEAPPTAADVETRRTSFHALYHEALQAELERVRKLHGVAILYDCHSIRSRIPYLFDGGLPDFNLGTNLGATCAPMLQDAALRICDDAPGYSTTLNGRFKGGWTTRHYGRPDAGCHAIQMELAQSTYLTDEAPPWTYDTEKAGRLRSHLKSILRTLADMASSLGNDQ
ncbi:MAG: N-formylglutamate deformylase [Boseongicola sp. SB0662_bin_57]|nr:N-formylglutamate deformylase [Boseongicola sp. SB0662_bin_57]